jgi:two-component system sensor histidine kinase BaeS
MTPFDQRPYGRMPYRRPRWWPEDEDWPPRRPVDLHRWQRMRRTVVWRAAAVFLLLLLLGGAGCAGTLWLLGWITGQARGLAFPPWALILVGVVILATLLPGFRSVALPWRDLIDAAGQVEAGDLSVRLPERGPRELRALARAFNAMVERLKTTEAVRRDLLADVTHELRTPITVIQGNLEAMLDGVYPADAEHITPVLEDTRVVSRLIDDLRTLSLAESGALELHPEATDLGVLIGEVVASFRAQADQAGVELRLEAPLSLPLVEIDPVRIREVLANLTANALRHTRQGGRISITAAFEPRGQRMVVCVIDNGSGIPADDLPHIFDRFFKSRESAGRGLGLAIAKNLVQAHGGQIEAESSRGSGTTMRVYLPTGPTD